MASTTAGKIGHEVNTMNAVKPIFLKPSDFLDQSENRLTRVEIYKAIGSYINASHLSGIQPQGKNLWRVYLDNQDDRIDLLTSGVMIRQRGQQTRKPQYNIHSKH